MMATTCSASGQPFPDDVRLQDGSWNRQHAGIHARRHHRDVSICGWIIRWIWRRCGSWRCAPICPCWRRIPSRPAIPRRPSHWHRRCRCPGRDHPQSGPALDGRLWRPPDHAHGRRHARFGKMADHARRRLSLCVVGDQFIELFRAGVPVRRQFRRRSDPKNISNLQFAPTFNIGLPDHWFITLYPSPDIRINYGDPVTGQTGRLFLPFDARIGRQLSKNVAIVIRAGGADYQGLPGL